MHNQRRRQIVIITDAHLCRNPAGGEASPSARPGWLRRIRHSAALDAKLRAEDDRIVGESDVRRHFSVLSVGGMGAMWSWGRRQLVEEVARRLRLELSIIQTVVWW